MWKKGFSPSEDNNVMYVQGGKKSGVGMKKVEKYLASSNN